MSHLADLERLQDGWNGPGSKAIHPCAFANFATLVAVFECRIPGDLEPMASFAGGLALEWDRGPESFFADLEPDGSLYLCHVGPKVSDDTDHTYPVFDAQLLKRFYETGRIEVTE